MSKRYYEFMARLFRDSKPNEDLEEKEYNNKMEIWNSMIMKYMYRVKQEHPRFSRDKFVKAIEAN